MEIMTRQQFANVAADEPSQTMLQEILNRTGSAQDIANEILARLFNLKDRLFGPEPIGATKDGVSPPPPVAFEYAYRQKATSLHGTLQLIDQLSNEINNRL